MQKKRDEYLERINELLEGVDIEAIRRDLDELAPDGKMILEEDPITGFVLICNIKTGKLTLERQKSARPKEVWTLRCE